MQNPILYIFLFWRGTTRVRPAFSIIEIVVAMAILSIISLTTITLIGTSETQLFESHSERRNQQIGEAIAGYIYDEFQKGTLVESATPQIYTNINMPKDLRTGNSVTLVSLLGNDNRFDGVRPRCVLLSGTNAYSPTFKFAANCAMRGGKSIAQMMNELITKGVAITLAIEGAATRCTIRRPLSIAPTTQVATVTVEDPRCLLTATNPARPISQGAHVLVPRFVAHNTTKPAAFHTTLIEPPGKNVPSIGLAMPTTKAVIGGGVTNDLQIVDATATVPLTPVSISLETKEADSQLGLKSVPSGVIVQGLGGRRIMLQGLIENVRLALENLIYQSPDGFFGKDELYSTMVSEPLTKSKKTELDVIANCGNQTCGSATRFDLGTFDAASGDFTTHKYLTTTSVCSTDYPTTYYGYCGTAVKYDLASGLANRATAGTCPKAASSVLQGLTSYYPTYQPPISGLTDFPYILYSPKARNQRPDAITVFVHEQMPLNTRDRYTLFFNFDTFDLTSGTVKFTLNNIEKGRNLDDKTDPFTMTDDPGEYKPRVLINPATNKYATVIGANGVVTAEASWQRPNDGVVIPLRLPLSAAIDAKTSLFELRDYWQDPDGDGNTNPNLVLESWTGLDSWNIRAVGSDKKTVSYQKIPFDAGRSEPKTAIQLVVSESQRCSSVKLVP